MTSGSIASHSLKSTVIPHFGGPSPAWKEAFKGMTFGQKRKVSTNYFAFFFPFIYLFILGLWKKALLVVVLNVVVFVLAVISGVGFLGYLINAIVALRTNTTILKRRASRLELLNKKVQLRLNLF